MPRALKKAVKKADEVTNEEVLPKEELPLDAHTYYVFKEETFVKYFINEVYKGEALKFAKLFADEIGGTVRI